MKPNAHVFVSYAAEDREVAREISEILTSRGHVVWWDRLIAAGAPWNREIERALSQACAVVVLWSRRSVESDYVRAEAREAARRGILIPALIEPCEPPLPFGEFQSLDLTAWQLDGNTDELGPLLTSLRGFQEAHVAPPDPLFVPSRAGRRRSRLVAAVVRYLSDLFALVTGPKSFLLSRWRNPDFLEAAVVFYAVTVVLELSIGLPLALKLGGSVSTELQGAFIHGPIRMVVFAGIVHMSWRLVGGTVAATTTLGTFLYALTLMELLYGCSQAFAAGLFRILAPSESEAIFTAVAQGQDLDVFRRVIRERGFAATAFFLALAAWPLVLVPIACWGAFRVQNQLSRLKSIVAATVAFVLGTLAYQALLFFSYASIGGLK